MKTIILFFTIFFAVGNASAQGNQQGVQQDPGSKVLLTTDTITMRSARNLEKENSDAVKTQNHPKATRKIKTVKKDSTSVKKSS